MAGLMQVGMATLPANNVNIWGATSYAHLEATLSASSMELMES